MEATKASYESLNIPVRAFVSLVTELIGGSAGQPNPDDPTPPGPWDPYIRRALTRLGLSISPLPDPWRVALGLGSQRWTEVALNPQPLPPKAAFAAFVAQEVIERASLAQEVGDAMAESGQSQGIIIVGGILSRFIDDCGNNMVWRKRPFPPPKNEFDNKLTGLELIVMGSQFEQGAAATANERLGEEFRRAGARLIEMGISRL